MIKRIFAITGLVLIAALEMKAQSQTVESNGGAAKSTAGKTMMDSTSTKPDVLPVFKNGDFARYVQKNLQYPEDARNWKIEGKVLVAFVVDTAGKILNPKVVKGIGYGCDEEALDLVNETSGKWIPGMAGGKKVRVRMMLPVIFSLGIPIGK